MVNLSKKQLTSEEKSVLSRGLNYAVTPKNHPVDDMIVAVEKACIRLPETQAEQVRLKTIHAINATKPPVPNVTTGEQRALKNLTKYKEITILPADKGRATVVLDTDRYEEKVQTMLSDPKTYEKLKKDPTPGYKKKLTTMLTKLKQEKKITESKNTSLPNIRGDSQTILHT